MRNKKVVEIDSFNGFYGSKNGVKVESFYNFLPTESLNNSKGVAIATFPTSLTNKKVKPLAIQTAGIEKVDGLVYFKQYFPQNGRTVYRLLVYGSDKKVYINQMLDDIKPLLTKKQYNAIVKKTKKTLRKINKELRKEEKERKRGMKK